MSVSTEGLRLQSRSTVLRSAVELLSSMRFSISLLTLICIASVIGTILKQNEPASNYVNQFGPFWAQVFGTARLTSVYGAWWFLLILAFLVTSTSLCVIRNTPKIIADLKTYKEGMREQSLQAFGMRAEAVVSGVPEAAARRLGGALAGAGWKVKLQQREPVMGSLAGDLTGRGWMVAAKAGAANKLGYIAAHSAIVLICIGGLLDGDLMVRAQMLFHGKTPYKGGGMIADVTPIHRLSSNNPTFRGNLLVSEGSQASVAILNEGDGILLQQLPFAIELKKFVVDYYSTGMPKLFASDIVIHDLDTGAQIAQRVEVNHPASYRGVEIYQSSFDDGGSQVKLEATPMTPGGKSFTIDGVIGSSSEISRQSEGSKEKLTLEFTGLRVINVENFANGGGSAVDVRKVDLRESVESRLGAANKSVTKKELRNVGPSISYKLRDASGQAREFNNYMLPVDTGDGSPVFLFGARENPADTFRYLRIPADDHGGLADFARLRSSLTDGSKREEAVRRYVIANTAGNADAKTQEKKQEQAQQLMASGSRALALFAGVLDSGGANPKVGGLQAISDFLEARVPEAERARAGEVLVRLLHGVIYELIQIDREHAGLPPLPKDEKTLGFTAQTLLALSDAAFYPAPLIFSLKDFTQVQASVFQVARAPGKYLVYLGCAFLILGVFSMLYVRERRIWIWLTSTDNLADSASRAIMAMSTNRKTMDSDREFEHLKTRLIGATGSPPPSRSTP